MNFKKPFTVLILMVMALLPSHSFNLLEVVRADRLDQPPIIDYAFSFHRFYGLDHLLIGMGKRGNDKNYAIGYMFISKKKDIKIDKVVFTIDDKTLIESSKPYPYTKVRHKMGNALAIYISLSDENLATLSQMQSMSVQHFYTADDGQEKAGKKIKLSKRELKDFKIAQAKLIRVVNKEEKYHNDDEDDYAAQMQM